MNMNNKVLVKMIIPELDINFDVFLPVNEVVWKIKKLVVKAVSDLTGYPLDIQQDYVLFDKDQEKAYDNNDILINTNIRNGSEIILINQHYGL